MLPGDDVARQGQRHLLVDINKIDLASYVSVSLDVMERVRNACAESVRSCSATWTPDWERKRSPLYWNAGA